MGIAHSNAQLQLYLCLWICTRFKVTITLQLHIKPSDISLNSINSRIKHNPRMRLDPCMQSEQSVSLR